MVPLTLSSGFVITGVDLEATSFSGQAALQSFIHTQPSPTFISGVFTNSVGTVAHPFGNFPLGPGIYDFENILNGALMNADVDWKLHITVAAAPVPTPTAFLLMGTGLLGLIGYRKWSTKNN